MVKLLLDTHFVLAGADGDMAVKYPRAERYISRFADACFISVASFWEIAIKSRLGKLSPKLPLREIPSFLNVAGFRTLRIDIEHVLTAAEPEPPTRDPFDRLLLAQCQVEGLQLVTIDRALVGHPLALRF
ncbi:type II toxin-antitoxin system VapC family toxin [Rhizobium sp. CSW-27]|nr:type II toxin-antitoxin system VapC family toxin [Rhizobium sp. CSW-27]